MKADLMQRNKVLHIITKMARGGAQENTLLTLIGLDHNKYESSLLTGRTVKGEHSILHQVGEHKIPFIIIPELVREISPVKDFLALLRLYKHIKKTKPDIVHTHTSKAGVLGRIAAWLAGVPIIIHTPHGHWFYGYFNKFTTGFFVLVERMCALITDRIITLTDASLSDHLAQKIGMRDKYATIHSGVCVKNFVEAKRNRRQLEDKLGIPEKDFLIGTLGRYSQEKGHIFLIKALPFILKHHPNTMLILIGGGKSQKAEKQKEEYLKLIENLHLEHKVMLLDMVQDPENYLCNFDVFLLPSINEGMGRVLIEAAACKIPIIASSVGGITDIIQHEVTGLLIKPKSQDDIADKIKKLIQDTHLRSCIVRNAFTELVGEYDSVQMFRKIDNLYQQLLLSQ